MRIAIVRHTAAHVGGTESYLDTVTPALIARGHHVATLYEDMPPAAAPMGEAHWVAGTSPDAAGREMAAWRPDVVYVNGIRSLDLEARVIGVAPAATFAHSYLGACISGTKTYAFPLTSTCARAFGPGCLAAYYPRRCGGISPVTMWRDYTRQRSRLGLLRKYARVLVASRHMAEEYGRHGLSEVTRVVPLPVSCSDPGVAPRRRAADAAHILYLGRLEWTKGPDLALSAAAIAASQLGRAITLTIAGTGTMVGLLRQEAQRLRQRNPLLTVSFQGWVDEDGRSSLLRNADLLLVPSRWPEPFGLAGIEAALHGVPSAAFAVGGIPDWLIDGATGVLARGSRRDSGALAAAIVDCLGDAGRLERMRGESRRAAARFSIAGHVAALEAELSYVANRPRVQAQA